MKFKCTVRYFSLIVLCVFGISLSSAKDQNQTLEIELLDDGVYLHRSYQQTKSFGRVNSNGLIVTHANQAYVIDTPWSEIDTLALVKWINDKGFEFVASVSTHSHEDRAGGIGVLNGLLIDTYASDQTNAILRRENKPQAKHSFAGLEFALLEDVIEVYYPGAGHAQDNLVVWLPRANIVFGGCLVRGPKSKTLGYVGEASIEHWAHSVESVLRRYPTAKTVVPGHGGLGDLELLRHTIKLANSATESEPE